MSDALGDDLRRLLGDAAVECPVVDREWLHDGTESAAVVGAAAAVVRPADAEPLARTPLEQEADVYAKAWKEAAACSIRKG